MSDKVGRSLEVFTFSVNDWLDCNLHLGASHVVKTETLDRSLFFLPK